MATMTSIANYPMSAILYFVSVHGCRIPNDATDAHIEMKKTCFDELVIWQI